MLKIVRRGTERLCALADVKRTAYEWQARSTRSSALRHGASTQGAVGGAGDPLSGGRTKP